MKKLMAIMLSIFLILAFSGCQKGGDPLSVHQQHLPGQAAGFGPRLLAASTRKIRAAQRIRSSRERG